MDSPEEDFSKNSSAGDSGAAMSSSTPPAVQAVTQTRYPGWNMSSAQDVSDHFDLEIRGFGFWAFCQILYRSPPTKGNKQSYQVVTQRITNDNPDDENVQKLYMLELSFLVDMGNLYRAYQKKNNQERITHYAEKLAQFSYQIALQYHALDDGDGEDNKTALQWIKHARRYATDKKDRPLQRKLIALYGRIDETHSDRRQTVSDLITITGTIRVSRQGTHPALSQVFPLDDPSAPGYELQLIAIIKRCIARAKQFAEQGNLIYFFKTVQNLQIHIETLKKNKPGATAACYSEAEISSDIDAVVAASLNNTNRDRLTWFEATIPLLESFNTLAKTPSLARLQQLASTYHLTAQGCLAEKSVASLAANAIDHFEKAQQTFEAILRRLTTAPQTSQTPDDDDQPPMMIIVQSSGLMVIGQSSGPLTAAPQTPQILDDDDDPPLVIIGLDSDSDSEEDELDTADRSDKMAPVGQLIVLSPGEDDNKKSAPIDNEETRAVRLALAEISAALVGLHHNPGKNFSQACKILTGLIDRATETHHTITYSLKLVNVYLMASNLFQPETAIKYIEKALAVLGKIKADITDIPTIKTLNLKRAECHIQLEPIHRRQENYPALVEALASAAGEYGNAAILTDNRVAKYKLYRTISKIHQKISVVYRPRGKLRDARQLRESLINTTDYLQEALEHTRDRKERKLIHQKLVMLYARIIFIGTLLNIKQEKYLSLYNNELAKTPTYEKLADPTNTISNRFKEIRRAITAGNKLDLMVALIKLHVATNTFEGNYNNKKGIIRESDGNDAFDFYLGLLLTQTLSFKRRKKLFSAYQLIEMEILDQLQSDPDTNHLKLLGGAIILKDILENCSKPSKRTKPRSTPKPSGPARSTHKTSPVPALELGSGPPSKHSAVPANKPLSSLARKSKGNGKDKDKGKGKGKVRSRKKTGATQPSPPHTRNHLHPNKPLRSSESMRNVRPPKLKAHQNHQEPIRPKTARSRPMPRTRPMPKSTPVGFWRSKAHTNATPPLARKKQTSSKRGRSSSLNNMLSWSFWRKPVSEVEQAIKQTDTVWLGGAGKGS